MTGHGVKERRRWGFRARLAALIAGVFIAGSVALLGVQYLLVEQLFAQGLQSIVTGCVSAVDSTSSIPGHTVVRGADIGVECTGGSGVEVTGSDVNIVIEQTALLSEGVLSGLMLWSIVVLVVFAGLAVAAAWWLSKRSVDRIVRITAMTREITRDDLHRRLDLPGPDDEVKELGDTIDGMLDRLDDAFTRQEQFIAGASHELRTPLTTTRTLLEIPLAQGRVPGDLEPAVRGALEANERSERLIAALLTLARGTQAPAGEGAVPVDLTTLVEAALEEHGSEAESRGLAVHASDTPVPARVNGALAGIAVGNLVENAIRHNRDHGDVRIQATVSGGTARVVIENDGREFDPAEVARLIEPFHRGDQTRLAGPGTGLGLTLADTVTRALGGTLTLAPRPGGGIIATLELPAGQP